MSGVECVGERGGDCDAPHIVKLAKRLASDRFIAIMIFTAFHQFIQFIKCIIRLKYIYD